MTEKEILKRLSDNEHTALEYLFKQYFKSLFLHIQPILVSHDNCQEAVQNTFIKLWEKRSTLGVRENLFAYLKKMAINEALMLKRAQKNHNNLDALDFTALDNSLERVMEQKTIYDDLQHCIGSLPEKIKETFTLYRLEGLTQTEIADFLGKAKKTIEAQLARSLTLLRNCLQKNN